MAERPDYATLLKDAYHEIKRLRSEVEKTRSSSSEPLAIIGMGCRFPSANTPDEYWKLLVNKGFPVTEIPTTRWDMGSFLDPETQTLGSIRVGLACLIDQVAEFDAPFFGISPREAKRLDPQQRLIMEVAWEALENAGYNPITLSGSNTGVYIGVGNSDYNVLQADERESIDAYFGTGNSRSITANRLSYFLNLTGPSMVVDTACSSSLVAIDLATSALRRGEIDLALVGGVSLILSPELSITFSQAQMLAPDGKCKTFDASANGYVRGEGAGSIVVKRLSDAERDGDFIYAVIRGTAVNQDGRSNGLTAPNGSAQMDVLKKALHQAGLQAGDVDFVEAHGTGTSLGDPIEMIALGQVYGQGHSKHNPLYVGSVKTNIGHLEGAAGMASIIKVALSLFHHQIPPHLHFENPSPYIPWDRIPVTVPTESVPLRDKEVYRAGVSGFGFGGTNAHAILESYDTHRPSSAQDAVSDRNQLIRLSAHTATSLTNLATQLGVFLETSPDTLENIAHTLNHGRADFEQRVGFVATSKQELVAQLHAFTQGKMLPRTITPHAPISSSDVVFMFTGQGSQYVGMFRELYEREPVFRQHLEHVATLATPYLRISLLDILYGDEADPRIHLTQYTQPILFAVEYALAQLWMSWGILPSAVIGHSVGEVVAAVICGVLSIEDGVRLITARGSLMGGLPSGGAMVAFFTSASVVESALVGYESSVSVAAINSPTETVVSGEKNAVRVIMDHLEKQHGIQHRELAVSHAFHSPLMEPVLADFLAIAETLHYQEPTIPYISNITGQFVEENTVSKADYWVEHIRRGVQFAQGVQSLYDHSYRIFIEVGPRPILSAMGKRTINQDDALWVASSRPPRSQHEQMLEALAQLYVNGVSEIRWDVVSAGQKIPLPTYAFEPHYYWWSDHAQPIQRATSSLTKALVDESPVLPIIQTATDSIADEQPQAVAQDHNDFIQHLSALDPEARRMFLSDFLRQQVASVLGASVAIITEHQRFFDLGLDSLMSVELKNRLDKAFGASLSLTLAFDYPSVAKLTDYLLTDVLSLQSQTQVATPLNQATDANEPIAVIGMAVRLPGGANDLEGYWHLLQFGQDAIVPVPPSRWDEHLYYDADYTAPGKTYSKGGGFLTVPVDEFDPLFFGISPREADGMDPQHRLLLEMSWEALEHANLPIHQLEGSRTGVFIGINTNDYLQIIFENGLESIDPTMATGSTFSAAAGRISYVMGLQGPSIAVDTACSSSLVTIHMACQSLRSHESNLALAGGVNLILSPLTTIGMAKLRALAADGRCKTFDANADGYGRGEGAGMVVLKRLSDALADGDRVWAVVRGSAVTQDGASGGLTVPNGPAQQAVIQQALHAAGVLPHEVDYVEAHGTGTPLGDPIELNALHATLAKGRNKSRPLYVGSVKTNIGHLEAAAGIAGFVKLVLSMHHQAIPPHINFHTPSPNIEWDKMAIEVPTQLTAWQSVNKPRIAGVSSFGFSGTNAHIIVQEGITPVHSSHTQLNRPLQWLALSARSEASLVTLAQRYADLLQDQPNLSLLDLAYTAHAHREHFAYRATFCAHDGQALAHQLSSSFNISYVARVQPKVAWMFTGQGSQMVGMARELVETNPIFQGYLQTCINMFDRYLPHSLYKVIFEDSTNLIHQTRYTQPALFALELSLAQTMLEWGMKPDFLIGHSIGEIVAACVSGIFSMDDAVLLVVERARLMDALPAGGGMLAVFASEETVLSSLASSQLPLQVAGLNHDNETVVSGELHVLNSYLVWLKEQGISAQLLTVSHAFHSGLMEPMLEPFKQVLESMTFNHPRIPIISNLTGKFGVADEMMRADYWVNHVRQAVRFADGIQTLFTEGVRIFIEVGARPILSNMGSRILGDKAEFIPLLHPRQSNWQTIYHALDRYYRAGFGLDWSQLDAAFAPQKISVPTYAFDRKRHWLQPKTKQRPVANQRPQAEMTPSTHVKLANGVTIYETNLAAFVELAEFAEKPILLGESVLGCISSFFSNETAYTLHDVEVIQPAIIVEDRTQAKLQAVLTPITDALFRLEAFIQIADAPWLIVLRANWTPQVTPEGRVPDDLQEWETIVAPSSPFALSAPMSVRIYQHHEDMAIHFDEPIALSSAMSYGLQGYGYGISSVRMGEFSRHLNLPVQMIQLKRFGQELYLACWDGDGRLVAHADHITTVDVLPTLRDLAQWQNIQDWFYDFTWQATPTLDAPSRQIGHWLVFADPIQHPALASAVEKVATSVTYVNPSDRYSFFNNRIGIRLNTPEDLERALAHASGRGVLQGVLFAWNLSDYHHAVDLPHLLDYEERIPTTFLQLATALAKAGGSTRLWGVTAGTQAVVGEVAVTERGLVDSMLWGLGRVITLEMPEIWGGMVDLDPSTSQFEQLMNEIATRQNEDQIAYRQGTRYVARLSPQTETISFQPFTLKPNASYLITGGLGKLGLLVATWMAERGAGRIILTSRGGLPPREDWANLSDASVEAKVRLIEQLESRGTLVDVVAVDVTDHENMTTLINHYAHLEAHPLRGIVHAAGVLASEYVTQIDQASLIRVLTPKVQGSWLLHQLTQQLPLDFFVQYSSAAATWGSAMAAHYVAANQFQDTLAHYRRSLGMKALSINWGWWSEGGMVSKEEQAYFDAIGLQVMPSEPAIMALEHWLAAGITQKTVAPVDWSRYKPVFEAKRQRPFLEFIQHTASEAESSAVDSALLERLQASMPSERFVTMVVYLQGVIGDLLRLDPQHPIDPQMGFFDVGMDSLTSVELKARLEQSLDVELPSTIAFEYPTTHEMATYLLEVALQLGDEPMLPLIETLPTVASPQRPLIADEPLDDLSDDDLLALLQDELK